MTYDELLETVNSYTIRTDAPVVGFIRRAESYLRTITKHYLSEITVSLPVTDLTTQLPADFREIRAITGTGTKTYKPVAPTNAILAEDEVGYYRSNTALIFVGTPDEAIVLLYSAAFPDLTASQSNWIFDRFPNVYLAAVLKEFYRWTKDPEGVAVEQSALQEALSIVAEDDRRGRVTGPIIIGGTGW
jgi:hypothetical protein